MGPGLSHIPGASALVALLPGHPEVFRFLAVAEAGEVSLVVPADTILEAQAVLRSSL